MNIMDVMWVIVLGGGLVSIIYSRKRVVKMEMKQRFTIKEMGIGPAKWQEFCHLAAYRRTSQSKQLGEAVNYFTEHGGR